MLRLLLLIKVCLGDLVIWSPDNLASLSISLATANFGQGSLLPIYGKLYFIQSSGNCTLSSPIPPHSFAILYGFTSCYFSDLALSVQNSGGLMMISVMPNDEMNFIMSAESEAIAEKIIITCISISNSTASIILNYANKKIWASYSYPFTKKTSNVIYFQMTSNYTEDLKFVSVFSRLSTKLSLNFSNFKINFCYLSDISELPESDCVVKAGAHYCLSDDDSTVPGEQMVYNSAAIMNYYNTLTGSAAPFLSFLVSLYTTCANDYSTRCMQRVLSTFSPGQTVNLDLGVLVHGNPCAGVEPFYLVGNNSFFSTSSIELSYCLTSLSPPSACTQCSSGCTYALLESSTCTPACNTTSCGNDDLNCLGVDGCYMFMLGDGNCNSKCPGDPDCSTSTPGLCAPGCSYSDMQSGLCPASCSGFCELFCTQSYCSAGCSYAAMSRGQCPVQCAGECFSQCSSRYCSPDCLYLPAGNCSPSCTSDCLKHCATSECTSGCSYPDMANGQCPLACAGSNCFQNCSSSYCSPDCLYSDLALGNCSSSCTSECLNKCVNNNECLPGCSYQEMEAGSCPHSCTGKCFYFCSSRYCSPGCMYMDISSDYCPAACEDYCCGQRGGENSEIMLVIIIVPIIAWILWYDLCSIGCCSAIIYCIYRRRNPPIPMNRPIAPVVPFDSRRLNPTPFNHYAMYRGNPICTIDLVEFRIGEPCLILPVCRHLFHPLCINEWLTAQAAKRCPNCNFNLTGFYVNVHQDNGGLF